MHKILFSSFFIAALLLLTFCTYDKEDKIKEEVVVKAFCDTVNLSYPSVIKPIIDKNCALSGCHSVGSPYKDFTSYAGIKQVITSGQFSKRVFDANPSLMPPTGFSVPAEKDKLKCWVDKGAPEN